MKFIEPLNTMQKKLSQFRYHFGKLRKNCKNGPIFGGVPGTVHQDASFQLSDITLLLKKKMATCPEIYQNFKKNTYLGSSRAK